MSFIPIRRVRYTLREDAQGFAHEICQLKLTQISRQVSRARLEEDDYQVAVRVDDFVSIEGLQESWTPSDKMQESASQ